MIGQSHIELKSNNEPLLSVVVPVYNVERYLRQCVESIRIQSYRQLQIVLVDDGSTDGSGTLCDTLKSEDERITVVHKANGGLSDARNAGVEVAIGDYVHFLDGDDFYTDNEVLAGLVSALNTYQHPDILLFCRKDFYEDNNATTLEAPYNTDFINNASDKKQVFEHLIRKQRFNMSACFQIVRRSLLGAGKVEFVRGLLSEDLDWSIQLWHSIRTVKAVNIYGYLYRHHSHSISTTISIRTLQSYDYMFDKWLKRLQVQDPFDNLFLQYLSQMFVSVLYQYFRINREDRAAAYRLIQRMSEALQYASTPKSLRVKKTKQIVGLRLTTCIFGLYGYIKPVFMRFKQKIA